MKKNPDHLHSHFPAGSIMPGGRRNVKAAFEVAWRTVTSDIRPQWKASS